MSKLLKSKIKKQTNTKQSDDIKSSNEQLPDEYYQDMASVRSYENSKWVNEVANKVATIMDHERPFTASDIFFDIGCGPGLTLKKIFYFKDQNAKKPSIGHTAYLVDNSKSMIHLSKNLSSIRCPDKGVMIQMMSPFIGKTDKLTPKFKELLLLPPKIDCVYCSLVSEYFSKQQIIKLTNLLIEKLSIGGIVCWFEWGEHYAYNKQDCKNIFWPRGISKKDWLLMSSEIIDYHEKSYRVEIQEKIEFKKNKNFRNNKFVKREKYTVSLKLGSII